MDNPLHIGLLIWNLIVFAFYMGDKAAAKNGRRRVPEKTLLILAALMGAPGALAGMYVFRHKTRRVAFRYGVPAILAVNIALAAAWVWLKGNFRHFGEKMEQKDLLSAHMDDLAARAVRAGNAASRFLTPGEAEMVRMQFARRKDVSLEFSGGFAGAERVRAVFLNADWGEMNDTDRFCALEISFREQDALTHRDFLGALMALGIERDTLGDIEVRSGRAWLICVPEMHEHIMRELTKIGRAGVKVAQVDASSLPAREQSMEVRTDTVASLRLDAVLGSAFSLSRTRACELIAAGRVSVDHQLCQQPAKALDAGALLSVRGVGRAKLLEAGGLSKKGRIFIKTGLFNG